MQPPAPVPVLAAGFQSALYESHFHRIALLVMQGQLANSVVGTPELVDGAVTHEKLADGAVSIAKLDVDAVAVITASAAKEGQGT